MDETPLQIVELDLREAAQARDLLTVLEPYLAAGLGAALTAHHLRAVIEGLRDHPTSLILLARHGDEPVGMAICFGLFSTYAARPALNIHDLGVRTAWRGRGVGRRLLAAVEAAAIARGYGRLTLEVRADNPVARRLYERVGFVGGEATWYWIKGLNAG